MIFRKNLWEDATLLALLLIIGVVTLRWMQGPSETTSAKEPVATQSTDPMATDAMPVVGPTAGPTLTKHALPREVGTLRSLVAELTSRQYLLRAPDKDERLYVDPTPVLGQVRRVATLLDCGEVHAAAEAAAEIDYEVIQFHDEWTDHNYYVVREAPQAGEDIRGWGSYVLNPESNVPALVEVPHPLGDSQTAKVATMVFEEGAKGLLIAGAHREKADVPDLIDSVFHQVHVAWTGNAGEVAAWQIHGFALRKHPFPRDAQAILSNGNGDVNDELADLDKRLDKSGIDTYVFNDLAPKSPENRQVNDDAPGVKFRPLAATQNEQGRHVRSLGGEFVHVELETSIRHDADGRRQAAEAIADAIAKSARRFLKVASRPRRG